MINVHICFTIALLVCFTLCHIIAYRQVQTVLCLTVGWFSIVPRSISGYLLFI